MRSNLNQEIKKFSSFVRKGKRHDRNRCNNMQPSKHKEHNDFIREPNYKKILHFFALFQMKREIFTMSCLNFEATLHCYPVLLLSDLL